MSVRIYSSPILREGMSETEYRALASDFRRYKATGQPPVAFGRDAPYNHPDGLPIIQQQEVAHIHLEDSTDPWPLHAILFHRTSDIHLVYCSGFYNPSAYLLMAILSPDAHAQARDNSIMFNLGKMAENFRNQY